MRINEKCAVCLFDKHKNQSLDSTYLSKVKEIIDNRKESDTAPYIVYKTGLIYEEMFGKKDHYSQIKKEYNTFVMSLENKIKERIQLSDNPLQIALFLARVGNFIDFGAMNTIDNNQFLDLLFNLKINENDLKTYDLFIQKIEKAKSFLLICDNCGEIVIDKIMIELLKEAYPSLDIKVMVRGGNVLNDATLEDALDVGMDKVAHVVTNGKPVAGTIYELLNDEAKDYFDHSDVILAKGQGNYESISGCDRQIFYSFLCKCDLFTTRFNVPLFTGMFICEG